MPKIAIFNCPKRSGKDAVANYLTKEYPVTPVSFKRKLIEIALCISMVDIDEWNERYEKQKDVPWDKLGGLSQRQYLIKISEEWVKPVHGNDYFGKALVNDIQLLADPTMPRYFLVTDGGFDGETKAVTDAFGENNVAILQWTRHGADWSGDSRGWVTCCPERTWELEDNNGNSIEFYAQFVYSVVDQIFNGESE